MRIAIAIAIAVLGVAGIGFGGYALGESRGTGAAEARAAERDYQATLGRERRASYRKGREAGIRTERKRQEESIAGSPGNGSLEPEQAAEPTPEQAAEPSAEPTPEPDADNAEEPADPCADVEYNQDTPDYDCGYFPE